MHPSVVPQPVAVLTYSANTVAVFFPLVNGAVNMPTLVCIAKLEFALPGCDGAVRETAHAKTLRSLGFSWPPDHLEQPVQATSTVQWVVLRDELRVRYVAEE